MFMILAVIAIDVVLLMLYGVIRMVLNERTQHRLQRERATAYFAAQSPR